MPVLLSYFSLPLVLPRSVALKISDEKSGLQIKNSENLKVLVALYLPQVHLLLKRDICNHFVFRRYSCLETPIYETKSSTNWLSLTYLAIEKD